jgi:adenylate cyclase
LVIDDMQWADLGSISLLFHLGRRLDGSRILILGAYRPEEIALGRSGERHPVEPLVHEFKRDWGEIEVALDRAGGRQFVEALLDSEPNQLGAGFRETLYRQTRGHPLFTIELLRGMQERGDLVQDSESRWFEGPMLDWEILPPRVEAVIAQRVERLAEPLKDILSAASVEGEAFTAEVVARAQAVDEQEMVASLSGELDRRHRLIRAQGIRRAADQRLSRYRFRHILFQTYLYNNLDEVERGRLHEQVGTALETLCGERTEEVAAIAPQLAWHFEKAGMPAKAITYYQQAGDRAVRMSANAEAIVHLTGGLELLKTLPDTPERAERELALQLAVAVPIMTTRSWGAPEADQAYIRARELCEEIGDTSQLLVAMSMERGLRTVRAEHLAAVALAEQCFDLAQRLQDPMQVMIGHYGLAVPLLFVGEFSGSLAHAEQVVALYDLPLHRSLAFSHGQDPAVVSLSMAIYDLWFLGYPDRALKKGLEALALAKELDHPLTSLFALEFTARLRRWRRETQAVQELAEVVLRYWTEHGMEMAEAGGTMHNAWVLSERGQPAEGSAQFERGLAAWQATGMANHLPEFLAVWAEMHGKAGDPEKGLSIVEEALALAHNSGERYYEAELYRLRGQLLLMPDVGDEQGAEASFYQAIEVARRRNAKMCELRATTSLCHLWLAQERGDKYREAHKMLAGVYDWFTEGFDTRDLQEAEAVLEALA